MSFPKTSDPTFERRLADKYNRYTIPPSTATMEQFCFPKEFTYQVPQLFLAAFMSPETPYTGLLIWHKIGAGKSCTGIQIAEANKKSKRIVVLMPASLIGNFRAELRSPCTGNVYVTAEERTALEQLDPASSEFQQILERVDARIDKVYFILSYNAFSAMAERGEIRLDNTVLLVDEAHNMISEKGKHYRLLHKEVKRAKGLRVVLLTATPIVDKPYEIALLMNLFLQEEMPTGKGGSLFNAEFINQDGRNPVITGTEKFRQSIRGHISYYQGAPLETFPRTATYLVKTVMSEHQRKVYQNVLAESGDLPTGYIDPDINNSFYLGLRKVSNITFPNRKMNEEGMASMKKSDWSIPSMERLSPKFVKILNKINRCSGTVFVYSSFVVGCLDMFARFLEHHGWKNYLNAGIGRLRYAVWTGQQSQEEKNQTRVQFNRKSNERGREIKLILGSPAMKEGITLLRVRQVHLMEPYWNLNRIAQIIGRAVRFCSHKDVNEEARLVKVFIYLAIHPKIASPVDVMLMELAVGKQKLNVQFERVMKEMAIDCRLFKNANKDLAHPIKCH